MNMHALKPSRRAYRNLSEFLDDFRFVWKRRSMLPRTIRLLIPAAFRERLMMVVTEVNGCRLCSYSHARLALSAGVSQDELRQLLSGAVSTDTPPDEFVALIYAQHWAESDARPDPEARKKLEGAYGAKKAEAIHVVLRMIRMGNLVGNLSDDWLFRLSFGRLGVHHGAT